MADIIELSSDSDVSTPSKPNNYNSNSDTTVETDLTDILNKYGLENVNVPQSSIRTQNDDSSDDDLNNSQSFLERLRRKYSGVDCLTSKLSSVPSSSTNSLDSLNGLTSKLSSIPSSSTNSLDLLNVLDDEPRVKKQKVNISEAKRAEKERKELEKTKKRAEKEQLKTENAKNKAMKQAMIASNKILKPEESIKLMTTLIDSNLISEASGQDIPATLQSSNISYKIVQQIHPFTISWNRKTQAQLSSIDGQLNYATCDEIILIMQWTEIVQLINEKSLRSNMEIKQHLLTGKRICLGIYGLDKYFRMQKQKKNMKDIAKISYKELDMALSELQIYFGISHRLLETPQDVSNMVVQFTKSISQIPYKFQKQQQEEKMDWFVEGFNKDCVRVDKAGNGLQRLWQQQLTQFTLARLETAEAISSKYSTPTSLIQAYDQCLTREEGEKLLQDIPIRRAAGPLTSVRKMGPELSKKIYTLFTSKDGNMIL